MLAKSQGTWRVFGRKLINALPIRPGCDSKPPPQRWGAMARRRYELIDHEWSVVGPLLPNKPRGVPRVDDRRVLNGILWRFRTGPSWAEIPGHYGPPTTCYNRFVRWRKAGVWGRLMEEASKAYDGDIIMIASTCVRVHQHGATGKRGSRDAAWDAPVGPHQQDPRARRCGRSSRVTCV